MPRVRIDNVGDIGVIRDQPGYRLPANAWTNVSNIRFGDGGAQSAKGSEAYNSGLQPLQNNYYIYPVQTASEFYWLLFGYDLATTDGNAFALTNGQSTEITRASGPYNTSATLKWTGTNFNGIPVVNNEIDEPQYWPFPISITNKLEPLPNWPSDDRAVVVRAYKNYLVALNITRDGVTFDRMVKWSDSADIGSVPQSWAIDDPTEDGGETLLPDTGGSIVDGVTLRDSLIIYRDYSTWRMTFVGGNAIFRFDEIFGDMGLLAKDCAAEFLGQHFVVTADDFIVHDGQNAQPVADDRVRDYFFDRVSTTRYEQTFVVHNHRENEIWVCYPLEGDDYATQVLTWSYRDNTWGERTIVETTAMGYGPALNAALSDNWDDDTATVTWANSPEPWNKRVYSAVDVALFGTPNGFAVRTYDVTNTDNSATLSCTLERAGLSLIGPDKVDMIQRKHIRAVYPHMSGTVGGVVKVKVAGTQATEITPTYSTERSFTIGTDYKVDFNETGRLMNIRFSSHSDISWTLHAYEIDLDVTGDA